MTSDFPKQSIGWIFTSTFNDSGFTDFPYVVCTGTLTLLFGVAGYEASAHLAEETVNTRVAAPLGMIFNIITTCAFGFVYLLILLINTPDLSVDDDSPNNVLNTNYATAAIQVFVNCNGKRTAFAMTALIVVMAFMAGLANMTITARVGFAMARDGAFPGSPWLKQVNTFTKCPVNMVATVVVICLLLLLIPLGNEYAFAAITSIATIGFQASYAIPLVLRLTTGIFEQSPYFNLGSLSVPMTFVAASFLIITLVFCFFPQKSPIWTVEDFPWTIVVTPGFGLIGLFYWYFYAQYTFSGPITSLNADTEKRGDGSVATALKLQEIGTV